MLPDTMSPPYPTFQTLPLHIVDNILDHFLDVYTLGTDNGPDVRSILHSCHSWRNALKNSKYCELNLSYSPSNGLNSQVAGPKFSYRDNVPPLSISNKTKKMHFYLGCLFSVFDGRLLDALLQSEYAALALPSVKDFSISFKQEQNPRKSPFFATQDNADSAQREVMRFAQYIRALVPNLKGISINMAFMRLEETGAAVGGALSKMISSLVDGIKVVTYLKPGNSIENITLDPDTFSGLTYFKYGSGVDDDRGLEIVLRNSSTLQCIVSFQMPGKSIDRMLYRENGDPIVYDCLEALEFHMPIGTMAQDTEDCTCHFPSLKKLKVHSSDPVLTNAFFNGTEMLEYMRLYTTYNTMDGINDRQVFKLCRLQNLKHLVLAYVGRFAEDMMPDDHNKLAQYAKFVESLAKQPRCLRSFSLTSSHYETKLVDILSTSSAFSSIQKLEFNMAGAQFRDIVSVIRNCPQLKSFKFPETDGYPSIDGLRDEELVRHLETKAYPLSNYLTSIDIAFSGFAFPQKMIMTMALLVVGCPRLSNIDCFYSCRKSMRKYMQDLAENAMFSNYRHRLQNVAAND